MAFAADISNPGGTLLGGKGHGRTVGQTETWPFDAVASVGAGVAVTTIQARLYIPYRHKLRGVYVAASAATTVTPATDPAIDVYRHLPEPDISSATGSTFAAALASPAAAGNVDNGTHHYAVTFYNAAGETTPSAQVSVAVADKTVNGQVALTGIPLAPSGVSVTGRKIYRTAAADAAVLILQSTIANNTATTATDNIADASLSGALPIINTAAATVLAATIKLSETRRNFVHKPVRGTLADDEATLTGFPACVYSLRAVTGAASGALTNLKAYIEVDIIE